MSRPRRNAQCVYCGVVGPTTSDHVPPKCLFPPGGRTNLITVPACSPCNASFKLDDEHFRLVLSFRADLPEGSTAKFLRESTKRSLRRPEAARLRASVLGKVRHRAIHSSGGIYLGHAPTIQVDYKRLNATANRIVKGLFFHFFSRRLPESHTVSVVFTDLQRDTSALSDPTIQELLGILGQSGTHHESTDVLELWARLAEDDINSSFWYVRIAKALGFFAFTVPQDG